MSNIVKGVAHGAFNVKDMDATLKFYKDVFGFERAFDMADPKTGKPWIVYVHVAGDQFIELFYDGVNSIPYSDANIGFSHLCFEVNDIQETAEAIRRAGAPLDAEPSEGIDGNWQCWTHDPDGNRIELMQMGSDSLQNKFLRAQQ